MVLVGGLVAMVGLATTRCGAKSYTNCTGLCESVLPCNDTYTQCIAFCTAVQDKCERVGHPSVFFDYVSCATDAGFTCDDAGKPVANAPCGPEQAELVQCDSEDDATLTVTDGAYDAASECLEAGSCLGCCASAYPAGAREYSKATVACICGQECMCPDVSGETHSCQSTCRAEVCASPVVQPEAGDNCDHCLASVLNEQTADTGACVVAITYQCNKSLDCALYVNCVSQAGCTN
jgi:hypothetical protein